MITRPGASRSASTDFAADGRWFGGTPETIAAADGEAAERMIPRIRAAVESYELRSWGDYRAWPGPNSNTFVTVVMAAVPELQATLPPTAIGKDYLGMIPVARTPSGTGGQVNVLGIAGITAGWEEGVEVNVLGLTFGLDPYSLSIKLPLLGRIGPSESQPVTIE